MYDYTDAYDEADNGGVDGGSLMLSRKQVVRLLKQHGHKTPVDIFKFFKESGSLCVNNYSARSVLEWLNY
ncbi:hypothetical protein FP371_24585 [Citrobacter freundii]|uniref:hypothetical protein n=1 Tax=Gammaproteobacteria TaxID=1236 RepID=UPI0005CFE90F|nr:MULTISPECIES: hypothetical protein [Gammaproteobacteria]EEA2350443.1 hypothetical protein [Salmonella enterica subsp. enterica serovar Enteritidis]EEC4304221.1 hypothetical protein [Salmonella enterica subsp. enterica serovar Enteritidis]EEN2406645.1 hypothetical protein [Salmonella enterica subsp. enterica serovar Enteritidis]EES8921261.1 hypothetical protein [Escherichia coli]EES9862669.1 hypothetical protein [Escherichia coli]